MGVPHLAQPGELHGENVNLKRIYTNLVLMHGALRALSRESSSPQRRELDVQSLICDLVNE